VEASVNHEDKSGSAKSGDRQKRNRASQKPRWHSD